MSDTENDVIPPQKLDVEHPSVARVYDYYLGGTTNWAVDRVFGDQVIEQIPILPRMALANRQFLNRAVAYLCRQGVRQFLDIGAGVPTAGNTHQVADQVAPGSRVVYVDNEPVAVGHAEMLLDKEGDPERHVIIEADLRNPDDLWSKAIATGVLKPDEPVGLLIIAVLHVAQPGLDGEELGPQSVARYRELLPAGSYLAISHATNDDIPDELAPMVDRAVAMYAKSSSNLVLRSRDEIAALLGDFTLVEPGMAWTPEWRPEEQTSAIVKGVEFDQASESIIWAGVGQKV
jgi:hypothetical protein